MIFVTFAESFYFEINKFFEAEILKRSMGKLYSTLNEILSFESKFYIA